MERQNTGRGVKISCLSAILGVKAVCAFAFIGPAANHAMLGAKLRANHHLKMVAISPKTDARISRRVAPTEVPSPLWRVDDGRLPWSGSIAGEELPLNYMPFMELTLDVLASQFDLTVTQVPEDLSLKHSINPSKPGRIISYTFQSPEIRKARLTYFDAGAAVQVFNMVIYPDSALDTPILGVDLISFGAKNLAGIDFQPLHDGEEYKRKYLAQLGPVKARYPDLSQQMSTRFYDSARFFSEHMLFARYEDPAIIADRLFPAFNEYFATYLETLKGTERRPDVASRAAVLDRHRAYDQYNAERDPAHGLFVQYFGNEWSEKFMDNYLFELSTRPAGGYPKINHCPPPAQGGSGGCQ